MLVQLRRFWIQVTSNRKRFGVLCAMVCVGMLLWARLIVVSRMPRTAIAEEDILTASEAGKQTPAPGDGERDFSRTFAPQRIELSKTPQRDPFVISPQFLPRANPIGPTSQSAGNSPKLPQNPVEESAQAQARITAQLQAAVDGLKLEAAVGGSMAVINGKTYRLGELIGARGPAGSEPVQFRLAEVRTRSAILECQNRTFEIHMPLPGGVGR
jgi:hypothetical protein